MALIHLGASPTASAAQECRYAAEHGTSAAAQSRAGTLSVGEVDRRPLPALQRLLNLGAHDIRITFDGAAPRQLARGANEPVNGRFAAGVVLRSVECLPERSARLGAAAVTLPPRAAARS